MSSPITRPISRYAKYGINSNVKINLIDTIALGSPPIGGSRGDQVVLRYTEAVALAFDK